jgi:xylulose-5-phosphate/fructose-6-phosphate phosphoketolase
MSTGVTSTARRAAGTRRGQREVGHLRAAYRRTNHANIHVRGYNKEEGTTTTPFDMVMDVIDRVPSLGSRAANLRQEMSDARLAARRYTREHGEDDPAIATWTWPSRV